MVFSIISHDMDTHFMITRILRQNKGVVVLALLVLACFGFFSLFNPESLPVLFLLVPFVLIFAISYLLSSIISQSFFAVGPVGSRVISLITGVMVVALLVMQSISQVTVRDLLLCLVIAVILVWYVARVSS